MPYIVVIIDEFGDLILTAGKEVEMPITRIAQLSTCYWYSHDYCNAATNNNNYHW